MIGSRTTIALLTGLLVCSMVFGATPAPERDAEIQAQIAAVVAAAVDEPDATQARIQDLQHAADGRREALLVQLALFLSDSTSTEEAMVGAALVQGLGFTPEEKLTAVLPHLETEPAALRKVLAEILGSIDRPDGGTPDFAFYEQILEQHGREPNAALIRYMYEIAPGTALASMLRVFGDGGTAPRRSADLTALDSLVTKHEGLLPWSDGERADADGMLDRLAGDASWWVRVYVAALLQQEPELGTADHRARLASDQDALVRSVAR